MGCVNIKSKEFKYLAERYNVSIGQLELITHKYWIENGTEDYFPSDVYIQAQLGMVPYKELSKAVRDLWELKYKESQEFDDDQALQEARKEALKYFPEEAVTYHKGFNDKYVMVVRKPIARMSFGIEDLLGRGAESDQELADFDIVLKPILKEGEKIATAEKTKESLYSNPLKPQYRGKLIYAQAGTGKSTIADNVDVIDSDYLLGEILGVSPETAGFFFNTLEKEQKEAFGKKYRELIKQKIAEGKTVLTANSSMLPEADVVLYNESVNLTEQRVNAGNRAVNNRYTAPEYHEETLNTINELQENEKNKEYIRLDNNHYVSDYLLSNPSDIDSKSLERSARTLARTRGVTDIESLIDGFLSEFDITVRHLEDYENDLPLFDALNRTINAKSPDDITEGVGYAVAFMMQSDPEMQKIIMQSHGLEGTYRTKVRDPRKLFAVRTSMGQMTRLLAFKNSVIKETGRQITEELRKHFGENIDKVKTDNKSIWNIIKSFFAKLGRTVFSGFAAKGNVIKASRLRKDAMDKENLFVADIVDALGRGDFSRIKGPKIKPGTLEKAQRIYVGEALKEHPFEDEIIKKLGEKGVALGGSPSIAVEGTLFRPLENPLHDLDFNAGDNSSRRTMDKVMKETFEEGTWAFSSSIINPTRPRNSTQTYVLLDVPFVTKNVKDKGFYAEYYSPDGKYLGKRVKSELYLEDGVKGKLLDFFVGPKAASKHGTHYEYFNGHKYLFSNSNAAFAAKILWARPKDMWDYKNFKWDRSTSEDLSELQMAMSAPQTFTFKDGTTVKAPFKPNYQQEDALNAMDDFVKSDRTYMTLSGYAGTGKTSLMEMLAQKMRKERRSIVFSATTNKAAAVLRNRVSKAGFTAQTLNKVFGIQVEVDSSKAYDATNLVPKLKEADIQPGTTVVIDEASMINEQNFDILNNIAKEYGLKIIYVGDEAQLAPVNEDKISKVFRNNEGDVRRLTIVERTDDNAILKEATAVRNGEQLSKESSFNNDGKGVAYVEASNRKEIADIVKAFAPKLKENPDYFRILAYTNEAVSAYNTATRNALGYTDNIPRVGEPIVGYANWGYEYDFITHTSGYKFINSESYKIIKVGSPTEVQKSIENGTIVNLSVLPITIQDAMGKTRNIDFIDIKGDAKNRAAATILAKEKSRLWDVARRARGKEKAAILREINNIDEFLFVNDNIIEGARTLQSKVFDFGYAMTVHKSQGSTFTHVLLDDVDIAKARNSHDSSWTTMSFDNFSELNFGDLSDMQEVGDFAPTEEMDLFGNGETLIQSMPEPIAQPSTESSAINIRQQLEYVGVSRATDTVTIISNNVKKADSPLNHITVPTKGLKEETKPASKMSSNDIWNTVAQFAQPLGERLITYAPVGKERQTYTVKGEHIYNKEGKEVFRTESKDRNKILANLAISEDRAVVVTHKNSQYVVDNNKEITSVATGNIMKWGEENGDRRVILNEAAQKFRDIIAKRQQRSSEITPELIGQLNEIGREVGFEVKNRKDIEQFVKNNNLDITQMFMGKKTRAQFEQQLRKARPDMTDAEIQSTLDFLHSLEDNKENTAYIKTAIRWIANKSITLPQDNTKARQVFDLARKKNIDLQKYRTLGELIASDEMKPKEKEKKAFNPDEAKTFSNKRTVTTESGRIFTVYDVEDTEEGQREVCKALAAHYEISPWCLSTFTATGEPTQSAKHYWNHYNALPRKIAYENGKPVAFNSNTTPDQESAVFKGMEVSYSSGDFTGHYISEENVGPTSLMESLVKEGLLRKDEETGYYQFTKKGEQALLEPEAWWDMEDTHAQDTLSDSIVSDPEAIGRGNDIAWQAAQDDLEAERREREAELVDIYDNDPDAFHEYAPGRYYEGTLEDLPFFLTPQGEIYGFVAPNNDVYLDETVISPEHPIHEYTHLWDRFVAKKNPKLWKQGVELMKQTSLWQEVLNDANYGKKWQAIQGMTDNKLESLIASEVHSRLVGREGAALLDRIAKEKGAKGIIEKLRQWILDFWKELKATFSDWSDEEINKLTLEDFNQMTLRDFADKINFNEINTLQQQITQEQQKLITLEQDLGGGEHATAEIADAVKVAKRGLTFEEALKGQESFFSKEEQEQIKQGLNGRNLQVMSVSRLTDPAFFSKEIVSFLEKNAEKPLNDPTRVTAIEIWSKHDGLPIKDILDACEKYRVAPMVSFSITGLGGTALEGGVMKYQDMLKKIGELIKNGTLNPTTTTVRIDPILPGITNMDDIRKIVETAKSYGIKKFVTSLVQSYGYTEGTARDRKIISGINNALATEGKTYNWDEYYGRDRNGKINFKPKQKYIDEIGKVLLELDKDPDITIQTCAFGIKGLKVSACLDPMIIERITGVDVLRKDGTYDRDTSRPECMCYGCHGDFFKGQNKKCFSSCAYCYAAHSGDNKLNYYNEDGTLKDNEFTRTERVQQQSQNIQQTQKENQPDPVVRALEEQPTETQEKETPVKVDLPGYKAFSLLDEDIEVDASWKVPLLKDLDANFTPESTLGENLENLSKMDWLLQAKSEEEYRKAPTQKEYEIQKQLTDYEKRNLQIRNLVNSLLIDATEVRHTAEQIVDNISDTITEIQEDPKKAKDYFPTLNTELDFKTAERKDIFKAIGIENLIELAKQKFDPESNDYDFDVMEQAELIIENWDAIIELASDFFVANEGFGITRDTKNGKYSIQEKQYVGYDYDNLSDEQDEDAIREEKDEQEHWQIESKTIDVISSMSQLMRMAFHKFYLLDRNGNKIVSKWGIPERIAKEQAIKSILWWTKGAMDIHEMIDKLSAKQKQNPWLSQLLSRLRDESGNEADFQSQFFATMHRHSQLMGIVKKKKGGVLVSNVVNSHPAMTVAMNDLSAKFQLHELPLFTAQGFVVQENLKYLRGWFDNLTPIMRALNIDASDEGVTSDRDFTEEELNEAALNLMAASRMLGYNTDENAIKEILNIQTLHSMYHALRYTINNLEKELRNPHENFNPFNFEAENGIRNSIQKFIEPLVEEVEEITDNVVFEDGKLYQTYIIPSYLTNLMDNFHRDDDVKFQTWLDERYGKSSFFKNADGSWRNPWLETITRVPAARQLLDHIVQLNFNKKKYMRNLSVEEYAISVWTQYFSLGINEKNQSMSPAWFRVPIMSNKPSSEFIKFYADRSANYKENITNGLYNIFLQELSLIDTVRKRNLKEGDPGFITSFDEQGRIFNLLPFLNGYLKDNGILVDPTGTDLFIKGDGSIDNNKNNEYTTLLNKKVNAAEELTPKEDERLITLTKEAIRNYLEREMQSRLNAWEEAGLLKAAEKIQNIGNSSEKVRENMENFLWNDYFATKNILQLTITDTAFHKNAEELQKRLAELHAPGTKGNKHATDYKGNPVSDGYHRTVILQDFDSFISNIISNISEIFDRKIESVPENEKASWRALKESLVDEKEGRFRKINVTDAQALSSPTSYRKKGFIFGKWSEDAEKVYEKLLNGDLNSLTLSDFEVAFQPLKPFVFGPVMKNMGVENAPIQDLPVPFQAKNAEYLLIMADALLQGQETGRPNLLRAVYRIMEDSAFDGRTYDENGKIVNNGTYNRKGIDTVQFNSAIKSGEQGAINLNQFMEMPDGEERAYAYMKSLIYQDEPSDDATYYNYNSCVQKIDYDYYGLQQEVPKHFKEHNQAEGSQQRMIIPSDLDAVTYNGDTNYYTWTDSDGNKHSLPADEFRKQYEEVHAQNIRESLDKLAELFHINSESKREKNLALSMLLQEEINSSPRYGVDLLLSCYVDPKTGEFVIPKGDPIQAKRIEQLINSIIKNRVNKQELPGGPIVQVSNWGASRQLHIRFKARSGGLLMMESEFQPTDKYKTYDQYKKAEQAGIAYFEVFAPASMKKLFDKFSNPDGTLNIEAIKRCDEGLLELISSRIPTEDKYSIAHMRIVGFMPELAGEAIMFPYELTEIDDSDFDVDKRYCQRREIVDIVVDWSKVKKPLIEQTLNSFLKYKQNNPDSYKKLKARYSGKSDKDIITEQVQMFADNPERMKDADSLMRYLYNQYQNILKTEFPYKVIWPKQDTREGRNNQIFDMNWAVLSNEMTAEKMLNPGGFEPQKKEAYVIAAYRATNGQISWEELEKKKVKELQKIVQTKKDLAFFDVQMQFYKQNAAGSNLIGVFAVNKVAHAILESDDILIDIKELCGNGFQIADTKFEKRMKLDPTKDKVGSPIGKVVGSMVGASADTAKDPWLDMIGINMTSAGVFNSLLRLGMPYADAALYMAQNTLINLMTKLNRVNLDPNTRTSMDKLINDSIAQIAQKYGYTDTSKINFEPLSREELKEGLKTNLSEEERDKIDYKVLLAFKKLRTIAKAIRKPTSVTRLNSISSAVGPLIIDNIILEHKLGEFLKQNSPKGKTGFYDSNGNVVDMDTILENHPILKEFSRTIDSRDSKNPKCVTKIMFSDMPAGCNHFKRLLQKLPSNIKDRIYDDRQLLSKLSDFYQSYMLIASGVIDPTNTVRFVREFPLEFTGKAVGSTNAKDEYPDNAIIKSTNLKYDNESDSVYLSVDTTGMKEQAKERLRMSWTDLHKKDKDMSMKLFTYSFFRGGIGFNPKTSMSLVSSFVKENIDGYVDTYRHFPTDMMDIDTIIDQFVRNNWDNYTLVPKKGGEGTSYDYSEIENGLLYIRAKNDKEDLEGVKYMKTDIDKETYMWRQSEYKDEHGDLVYERVWPLGNNGEYLEMSLDANLMPAVRTVQEGERDDVDEFPTKSPMDDDASDGNVPDNIPLTETEQSQMYLDIINAISQQNNVSTGRAIDLFKEFKERANKDKVDKNFMIYLTRLYERMGIKLNPEEALEKFREIC